MLALIDGDIVVYRCAASCEPTKAKPELEPEEEAIARVEGLLQDIVHDTGSTEYQLWLSGKNSFRKRLDPNYKANRTRPEPTHLQAVKKYVLEYWDAKVTDDIEADDALGINCKDLDTVICTIDKDLLQVPGNHYNFVKKEHRVISEHSGWVNFFTQMIIGDKSDNVTGFDGKARADIPQFIQPLLTDLNDFVCDPEAMFDYVKELYELNKQTEKFENNFKLLWIWREEENPWSFLEQQLKAERQ